MSVLLSVTDAHVAYGKVEAVRAVNLEVRSGEIVTIIGANGAGKTTLLNAAMGILPLKGVAAFAGADMAPSDIEDRVAAGLSLVPEHRELFGTMNVEDNLELGAFRIAKATAACRCCWSSTIWVLSWTSPTASWCSTSAPRSLRAHRPRSRAIPT